MDRKIFKTVETVLNEKEIQYDVDKDMIFSFRVKGEQTKFNVHLACEDTAELLLAVATAGVCVPKEKIGRMCRWIVEFNHLSAIGGFAMDTSDGEISFRVSCPLGGGAVTKDVVLDAIAYVVNNFDGNYEKIIRAMYAQGPNGEDLASDIAQMVEEMIKESGRMIN